MSSSTRSSGWSRAGPPVPRRYAARRVAPGEWSIRHPAYPASSSGWQAAAGDKPWVEQRLEQPGFLGLVDSREEQLA